MLISQALKENISMRRLINLIDTDGNFQNSAGGIGTGWVNNNCNTLSVSSNVQSFKSTAQYGNLSRDFIAPIGNIIYACATIQASSGTVKFTQNEAPYTAATVTADGTYKFVSIRYPNVSGTKGIDTQDSTVSGWQTISMKLVFAFNLTAIFGTGKEPSKADMDIFMQKGFPYFTQLDYCK